MNRIQLRRSLWVTALIALGLGLLPGCKQVVAPQAPQAPAVTVSQPLQRDVIRWDQYTGNLSSPQTAIVDARVSGLIEEAPFQEGAVVHQGDLLFKIDPRPFQADLDNKKAAVALARATADKTKADFERSTMLLNAQVLDRADYDSNKASYLEAAASLKAASPSLGCSIVRRISACTSCSFDTRL